MKIKLLDASLIIASLSAMLYFTAYFYKEEVFKLFKIPITLINLNLESILSFSSSTVDGVFQLFFVLYIYTEIISYKFPVIKIKDIIFFFQLILFLVLLDNIETYGISFEEDLLIVLAVVALIDLILVVGIILLSRSKYDFIKIGSNTYNNNLLNILKYPAYVAIVFLTIPILAAIKCDMSYQKKSSYYVTGKSENIIVLEDNNDVLICKPFNPKTHRISDSTILIKINDTTPVIFKLKKIGPLNFNFLTDIR